MSSLFGHKAGLDIEQKKEPALSREVRAYYNPPQVKIVLPKDYESAYELQVSPGESIGKYQLLLTPTKGNKLPIFATIGGRFQGIHPVLTQQGKEQMAAVIKYETDQNFVPDLQGKSIPADLSVDRAIYLAKRAGIVDEMDKVPLYVKLEKLQENAEMDRLYGYAVDDEPFISSQTVQLLQLPYALAAFQALCKTFSIKKSGLFVYAHLDSSKIHLPDHLGGVRLLKVRYPYPAGIRVVRDLNKKKNRMMIGVGALHHFFMAAAIGMPHIHTLVTVAGDCVTNPVNLLVPQGTSVEDILHHCGLMADPERIVVGGSISGFAVDDLSLPVMGDVSGVLALSKQLTQRKNAVECIGCGLCVDVCPSNIMPVYVYKALTAGNREMLPALRVADCIGCGCCSYVCKSNIDLYVCLQLAAEADRRTRKYAAV